MSGCLPWQSAQRTSIPPFPLEHEDHRARAATEVDRGRRGDPMPGQGTNEFREDPPAVVHSVGPLPAVIHRMELTIPASPLTAHVHVRERRRL